MSVLEEIEQERSVVAREEKQRVWVKSKAQGWISLHPFTNLPWPHFNQIPSADPISQQSLSHVYEGLELGHLWEHTVQPTFFIRVDGSGDGSWI